MFMATLKISEDLKKVIKQVVLDTYYPIGKMYITIGNEDPNKTIGGKWIKISGGYLYACSGTISNSSTTGVDTLSTTLSIDQIPAHSHAQRCRGRQGDIAARGTDIGGEFLGTSDVALGSTFDTGGGKGHKHAISYRGVWVWKRTA